MPAPLTPPDCDLQDFSFMPLHVARLRDSDLAAEASPEACWYAVLLWAASWHQVPAASLPDNDSILARLLGLGRDVKTFRKHRDAALRGFILCDDGRLYHPVVAEQALNSWNAKLQQRWRTECARIKKHNQRHGADLPFPSFEEFVAGTSAPVPDPRPEPVPRDNDASPQGQYIQETGTGIETGIIQVVAVEARAQREASDDWPKGDANALADDLKALDRNIDPGRRQGLILTVGEISRWRSLGYSWFLDVIPAVQAHGARAGPDPVSTWKFFTPIIERNHANRTRPIEPVQPDRPHERHDAPSAKFSAKQRNLAVAATVEPARRERFIG